MPTFRGEKSRPSRAVWTIRSILHQSFTSVRWHLHGSSGGEKYLVCRTAEAFFRAKYKMKQSFYLQLYPGGTLLPAFCTSEWLWSLLARGEKRQRKGYFCQQPPWHQEQNALQLSPVDKCVLSNRSKMELLGNWFDGKGPCSREEKFLFWRLMPGSKKTFLRAELAQIPIIRAQPVLQLCVSFFFTLQFLSWQSFLGAGFHFSG